MISVSISMEDVPTSRGAMDFKFTGDTNTGTIEPSAALGSAVQKMLYAIYGGEYKAAAENLIQYLEEG
jgi:hypothetical protein